VKSFDSLIAHMNEQFKEWAIPRKMHLWNEVLQTDVVDGKVKLHIYNLPLKV